VIAGAPIPKQYCRIVGDRSLLETTLARIAPLVPPERTLAIVNRRHLRLARPQLAAIPAANVLVQPRNLDTGPGLLVSLLALARRDAAATVAVFPSDHDIRYEVAFRRHVARMAFLVAAHPDRIALLGARPERPETGYGYVAVGHRVVGPGEAFRVVAFHEKPAPALAARIIGRGGLWNSFVMVGQVARMLELVREVRPGDVADLEGIPAEPDSLAAAYDRVRGVELLARLPGARPTAPDGRACRRPRLERLGHARGHRADARRAARRSAVACAALGGGVGSAR